MRKMIEVSDEMVDKLKDLLVEEGEGIKGLEYVIVRTFSAGVFSGYLKGRKGKEVMLLKARRFWYWSGAASLSQLAMEGTKKPKDCKFPCEVDQVELTEVIEILTVTATAKRNIQGVPVWEQ